LPRTASQSRGRQFAFDEAMKRSRSWPRVFWKIRSGVNVR
jgi:hypothetical protein